ncbi:hypothetical protein Ccrd_021280 [Cynara cardunculus var. scolymus]|uniref:NAD(P)-binding domain-containing protein n=1 Tax=Cynara cardunculus var. scolymus TaxID=59895 RepID=A0A124SEL5_CYNCS|nr:hypothetical protein Ccrd_021280 [Cynara cardunculus var. scolymus]
MKGDTRNSVDLEPSMFEGVTHVICCTGTTAFPSRRWDGDNTPERFDVHSKDEQRLLSLVAHILGRREKPCVSTATITDKAHPSFIGDKLVGEVSRLVVAEACIQALDIDFTQGQIYEINSVQGDGPGSDTKKWQELFKAAQLQ